MKRIFVDGYNVINSWPNLRLAKEVSYESARVKLIDTMLNYSSFNGSYVIVVFDAHMVKGAIQKKEKIGNVTVVFTKEGETADTYIEKTVNSIGRLKEVYVVTSDCLEQQLIFQRGAIRITSLEFYHKVSKCTKGINKSCAKKRYENKILLEDVIGNEMAEKLEKIRRSK